MSGPTGHPDGLVPVTLHELVQGRPAEQDGSAGPVTVMSGEQWLRMLPRSVERACVRWGLRLDGASRHGTCALVVPVRRGTEPAALKVTWPHADAVHEHLALRSWAGRGAVRLLAADPASATLLLERLDPDRSLTDEDTDEACVQIGRLLRDLDRPAPAQLPTLVEVTQAWLQRSQEFPSGRRSAVPRRFVDQARAVAADLIADLSGTRAVPAGYRAGAGGGDRGRRLVHTDLHFENVLAGGPDRAPGEWVAIDPKPLAAEPAYGVWPVLHNRWNDIGVDPRRGVHRRLGLVCEAAGIEQDRARAWALVRTVQYCLSAAREQPVPDLTEFITLAKALQPDA